MFDKELLQHRQEFSVVSDNEGKLRAMTGNPFYGGHRSDEEVPTTNTTFDEIRFLMDYNSKGVVYVNCLFKGIRGQLANARFIDCRFTGGIYDAGLEGAAFLDCEFEDGGLRVCSLVGSTLHNATFKSFYLDQCHLQNTKLEKVTLDQQSKVTNIDVQDSSWTGVIVEGPVREARFNCTKLDGVKFLGDLRNTLFSMCFIHRTYAKGAMVNVVARGDCKSSYSNIRPMKIIKLRCNLCKNLTPEENFYKPGMCNECVRSGDYSKPNSKRVGARSSLPTFSIEFETHYEQRNSFYDSDDEYECRNERPEGDPVDLLLYGFTRHHDGSVDDEYKSPIYRSMIPFDKVLPLLDELSGWVDNDCGTHIHVGFSHRGRLRRHYEEIFGKMEQRMVNNNHETEMFWGRYFTGYALINTGLSDRYHWLNVTDTGKPTIEFRLAKFDNAKQYGSVVVFVRELCKFLDSELDFFRTGDEYGVLEQKVYEMYKSAVEAYTLARR